MVEVVGSNPTVPTNHRIFLSLSFGGNRGSNYLVSFLQTFCTTLAMLSNPSLKRTYQSHKVLLNLLGTKVDGICRHLGISSDTPYNWRSKYEGLEVNEAKCLREPESENNKLKRLLADKLLEVEAMKDVLSKKVVTFSHRKLVCGELIDRYCISERDVFFE
jgi:putative transposase